MNVMAIQSKFANSKISLTVTLLTLLSGCGDRVVDDSYYDAMLREAMCVIASEHFSLVDEVEKHTSHGLDANRSYLRSTGKTEGFVDILTGMRNIYTDEYSNGFFEEILKVRCNRRIKVFEFEQGKTGI